MEEEEPRHKRETPYLSIALGNHLGREFHVADSYIISAGVCFGLLYIFASIFYLVLN
jgi:hypothetical protein